jgi:hypothetical protein
MWPPIEENHFLNSIIDSGSGSVVDVDFVAMAVDNTDLLSCKPTTS